MIPVAKKNSADGNYIIPNWVTEMLVENNTFCPAVIKTVFNLKTTEEKTVLDEKGNPVRELALDEKGATRVDAGGNPITRNKKTVVKLPAPILTTTCFFEDGTSVTVKNSPHDEIKTETVWLDENGDVVKDESKKKTEVTVASECSKERGICYAIVKRLCSTFDDNGKMTGSSAGGFLSELISAGEDQVLVAAKAKAVKAAKKAKREKNLAAAKKPAKKRYSNAEIKQLLGAVLEKITLDDGLIERLEKMISARD